MSETDWEVKRGTTHHTFIKPQAEQDGMGRLDDVLSGANVSDKDLRVLSDSDLPIAPVAKQLLEVRKNERTRSNSSNVQKMKTEV